MPLKNTRYNYGTVAKWLHWLIALLFLVGYISVYYRHWFTDDKTPENWIALQIHLSVGVSIAALVILRILWRATNRAPDPEPGSQLEHLAAHAGHYALYAVMVIMPLTGYLGTGVATEFFFLFDIPKFADTNLFITLIHEGLGLSFDAFEDVMDFIHMELLGKWLAWLLILGHILAALYHHHIRGDRTLLKMTTGQNPDKGS
jgi:cytochrome b561